MDRKEGGRGGLEGSRQAREGRSGGNASEGRDEGWWWAVEVGMIGDGIRGCVVKGRGSMLGGSGWWWVAGREPRYVMGRGGRG